ncbi:unnamed protein product [Mucor hiemalis]
MVKVYTIGVGGPSCSGKTTLTRILRQILKRTVVIYQDNYYKPEVDVPIDEKTQLANWNCPESLLSQETAEELSKILAHLVEDSETVFVFVDGFMLYWDERVNKQLDLKSVLTLPTILSKQDAIKDRDITPLKGIG